MKIDIMPIKWFGDRNIYEQSSIKVVTVGLNPSDREFRESDDDPCITDLRFPDFRGDDLSLETACNNYFSVNPYRMWFTNGFEHILNGMDASYFGSEEYGSQALHTDFCSCWATLPTWSGLRRSEKSLLMEEGVEEWKRLISELEPHVILFSIPRAYYLQVVTDVKEFRVFDKTSDGTPRSKPVTVLCGRCGDSLAIMGQTWNVPFGALGAQQKERLGNEIFCELLKNPSR